MSARILVADEISQSGVEVLQSIAGATVELKTKITKEELADALTQYEGVVVRSRSKLTKETLEKTSALKIIGRAGTGVDNVDVPTATRKGIVVMNTPGGNTVSAAEHTMGMLLSCARNIPQASNKLKSGVWEKGKFTGVELTGKVLGIIGLGRIGKEVAKRARSFGMTILAYDPYLSENVARDLGVTLKTFEETLPVSDFITLHLPLMDSTKHVMNKDTLSRIKKGAYFINCARGELVDENALLDALNSGHLGGAALDVFETEPPQNKELVGHARVVVTPHLSASTVEAQERVSYEIALQIKDYFEKGLIRNAVNFPSLSSEEIEKLNPFLTLADKCGRFVSQMCSFRIKEAGIRYYGDLRELNTKAISAAAVCGVLKPMLAESVNVVNSLTLARERGINIVETQSPRERSYSNLLSIQLRDDKNTVWVEGTVLHGDNIRFVSIDNMPVDCPVSEHLLVLGNMDMPGVIGQIGTLLGKEKVNIASFSLARIPGKEEAIAVLSIDSPAPPDVLAKLLEIPQILSAKAVDLT